MQQNQELKHLRSCTIKDHKQKEVLQICCFEHCKATSRWACEVCIKQNLHLHTFLHRISYFDDDYRRQGYQQSNLKDQQEFELYLQDKAKAIEKSQNNLSIEIKQLISKLQVMQTEINSLIKFLQTVEDEKEFYIYDGQNKMQFITNVKNKIVKDYYSVSIEEIDKIIKISDNSTDLKLKEFEKVISECLDKFKKFLKDGYQFSIKLVENQVNYILLESVQINERFKSGSNTFRKLITELLNSQQQNIAQSQTKQAN